MSPRIREHDLWALQSDLPDSETLSDHIMRIRELVLPHGKYIKTVISKSEDSDIILGCYTGCTYPVLCLEPKALRFVSSFGLGLAFNFTVG